MLIQSVSSRGNDTKSYRWVNAMPEASQTEGPLDGQMAVTSDRLGGLVAFEPELLDINTACKAFTNVGQRGAVVAEHEANQRPQDRRAHRFSGWRKCGSWESPEMYSRTIGNGGCDPASIAVLQAGESCIHAEVGAGLKVCGPAIPTLSHQQNPVGPGTGRQARAAMTDPLVFGAVCDRCGRLYSQRCFPHGCLCPSCSLGGSKATRPRPWLPASHFCGVGLAPT
jgi:hypothetical protein